MRAARWLALSLALALAEATDDLVPGVRVLQSRPKRQHTPIIFPNAPFDASPPLPVEGPGRFAPRPPPPSVETRANANPEDGPDETLELPEDLDLNALDSVSLSRVNSINNISDFADLFGIHLPVSHPIEMDFRIASRFGDSGGVAEMATMATCKPEVRTVPLDLPVEANTLYYPTCVRMEQCGGCCYGPLLTCRPKVTKVVKLKVLKTVVKLSSTSSSRSRSDNRRNRRRRRRRRESTPSYHEVDVLKHVQCECGCKVQEQDCNPAIHTYLESDCACICKSRDEKSKCEQQNDTKYWDNDSCACYCRRSVDCSSGEFFSQTSCKCERLATRGGFSVDAVEGIAS